MTNATQSIPANITIQQLGGIGRLRAMVGGKDFMHSNEGRTLTFKFKGCRKANCVRITLNALDLYDIEFIKNNMRQLTSAGVKDFDGIYADQMVDIFETFTGLYLSM